MRARSAASDLPKTIETDRPNSHSDAFKRVLGGGGHFRPNRGLRAAVVSLRSVARRAGVNRQDLWASRRQGH